MEVPLASSFWRLLSSRFFFIPGTVVQKSNSSDYVFDGSVYIGFVFYDFGQLN